MKKGRPQLSVGTATQAENWAAGVGEPAKVLTPRSLPH